MRALRRLGLLALGALASGAGDPAPEDGARAWNLVLVTADTLRADHLGCYGYFRDTSPRVDALARESVVFDDCVAPIPRTTPSHLALMTGAYPLELGMVRNDAHPSPAVARDGGPSGQGLRTAAQLLAGRGYRTGGFVSAAPVKRITGLDAGFATWEEPEGEGRRLASDTNTLALPWIAAAEEPFFAWVHYMDAHGPYGPEDTALPHGRSYQTDDALRAHFAERRFGGLSAEIMVNIYDGAVHRIDDAVGELLDVLAERGALDRTVFVFTSDHGQGLGQHGYPGHETVWGEQLRVPLLLRAPGLAPARVERLVSTLDILPTALARLPGGAAPEWARQGHGLDALAPGYEPRPLVALSVRKERALSLTTPRWKYVLRRGAQDSLFDRTADPHELDDRIEALPDRAAALRAELLDAVAAQRARAEKLGAGGGGSAPETQDARGHAEELRQLGYAGDEGDEGDEGDD